MKKSFYKSTVSIFALLGALAFLNPAQAMEKEDWDNNFANNPAHMGGAFDDDPSNDEATGPLTSAQIEWCIAPFTEYYQKYQNIPPGQIKNEVFGNEFIHYNIFQFLDLGAFKALRLTSRGFYHTTIRVSEQYLKEWTLEHSTRLLFVLLETSRTESIVVQRVLQVKLLGWEPTLIQSIIASHFSSRFSNSECSNIKSSLYSNSRPYPFSSSG